jgi:uncharacterized protein involved in response to NO
MPRMLSVQALRPFEVMPLLALHLVTVIAYASGCMRVGNALFLLLALGFAAVMCWRLPQRKDMPPPGFVLPMLGLVCVSFGAAFALFETEETSVFTINLQRLLTCQGFVLLPILGIGPFILPRFYGLSSSHDMPDSRAPNKRWWSKAFFAAATGAAILFSFAIEAAGSYRLAYAVRFAVTLAYILMEMPVKSGPHPANIFGLGIRIALIGILAGFLTIAFFPAYRVGLLHLTLIGGFAVITFIVATRVLFGHSGNLPLLKKRNRWFSISMGLMLFGMATRISGDFWPKIMASHYIYGAIIWIAAVALWAFYALPKALMEDIEE